MIIKIAFNLLIIFSIVACSTVSKNKLSASEINTFEINRLLSEAHQLSKNGNHALAINKAKQGIKQAQRSNQITHELIEGYDDLGLYYFQLSDYKKSTYYQSIAVALSYFHNPESKVNKTYFERLGWAYAKYDPTFNLAHFRETPLLLVCKKQLNIHMNADIKRFIYKRDKALSLRRNNKLGMYQLRKGICRSE